MAAAPMMLKMLAGNLPKMLRLVWSEVRWCMVGWILRLSCPLMGNVFVFLEELRNRRPQHLMSLPDITSHIFPMHRGVRIVWLPGVPTILTFAVRNHSAA